MTVGQAWVCDVDREKGIVTLTEVDPMGSFEHAAEKVWTIEALAESKKNAQLETLNWVMQLCGSGQTVGMIRRLVHNRFVEISGEGEKA